MSETRQLRPHWQPGAKLDNRFEIVKRLGGGKFGSVYLANQIAFGRTLRQVALKLFETEHVNAENFGEICNDALVLISMQEENPAQAITQHMIQIYDVGILHTPAAQAFMSMKLVRGGKTLEAAVQKHRAGGMPVALALYYLRQILLPLAWMHTLDSPLVHADLKPDNILLTEDERSKVPIAIVSDFGLATRLPVGVMAGAIQYQAPETLAGQSPRPPADVYGLGLILYELLTGHHPFTDAGLEALAANDEQAFIRAHYLARQWEIRPARPVAPGERDLRIVPASELNQTDLPDHLPVEAMLNKCLRFNQSERYLNARLLLDDVDLYLSGHPMLNLGVREEAEEERSSLEVILPEKTPENLVADALTLLKQGQAGAALGLAEKALQTNPKFIPALLVKARAVAATGDLSAAKEICRQAGNFDNENPDVYETMADLLPPAQAPTAQTLRQKAVQLRNHKNNPRRRF